MFALVAQPTQSFFGNFTSDFLRSNLLPFRALERAESGARFLDQARGGSDWDEKVNPDILNIGCPHRCVLGQVYDYYGIGVAELGIDPHYTAAQLGFNGGFCSNNQEGDEELDALDHAWLIVLNKRMEAKAA